MQPTSKRMFLYLLPIFNNVPPASCAWRLFGDNTRILLPIVNPPFLPVATPALAATLKPLLRICEPPAIIPPAIKPSAKLSIAEAADFFKVVFKSSPELTDFTAVIVALVPAEMAPEIRAAFAPAAIAGRAAPPVSAVIPTPIAIAIAPIAILASQDNCPSSSLSFTGLLLQYVNKLYWFMS